MSSCGISTPVRCLLPAVLVAALTGCQPQEDVAGPGSRAAGKLLLEQYDCGSCHLIPGVRRAQGTLGPDLDAFAHRAYIAGEIPNEVTRLQRWIEDPPQLVPDTLMPSQQVPSQHARDMVAYLMSLR